MAKARKRVPPPRKPAATHDDIPRHADWQNPRVVQILDAASRCFARDGFSGTTVQQIAREAGLTKSMIHYYFESKSVLILELQAFVHERYFRKVKGRLEALGPGSEQRMHEALWEVYEIVKDKQFLRLQLELFAEAGRDPNMRHRMQLALEQTRDMITAGAHAAVNEGGDSPIQLPKSLAFMIASTITGLRIQEYLAGDSETAEQSYKLFISMLTGAMQIARRNSEPPPPSQAAIAE